MSPASQPRGGSGDTTITAKPRPTLRLKRTPAMVGLPTQRGVMALLTKLWPDAFDQVRPLAVGMREQLLAAFKPPLTADQAQLLSKALRKHCTSPAYLHAIANGMQRINLDGSPAGEPDAQQRADARGRLDGYWQAGQAKREREAVRLDRYRDTQRDLAERQAAKAKPKAEAASKPRRACQGTRS